jgi:tRNA-splicing ligase RtcB
MSEETLAVTARWVVEPPPPEVEAALGRLARSEDVRRVAVMPDVHLAADVCVGTVVGTGRTLYPNAVGGDIGCGVATVRFTGEAAALRDERRAARVMAGLYRTIPEGRHPRRTASPLPEALATRRLSAPGLERLQDTEGPLQLGTLGRGNHFVEMQEDDDGLLWLMVHSGSRGLGPAVRDHHLGRCHSGRQGLRYLEADSPEGEAYRADLDWALDYAEASRRAMIAAAQAVVAEELGFAPDWETFVSCHHNHVRREVHFGEAMWVHRKGATPAGAGERGLIPGSMGTASHHVEGRGCAEALGSSAHGAGRRWSRTEARRRISRVEVARQLRGVFYDHRLADALREEAPTAYKDVDAVLRAQRELVRSLRRVRPVLCYKGA